MKKEEREGGRVFKKGDAVGFVYAQPGNDTTSLVVLEDSQEGKKVRCWDLWFQFEIEVDASRLWLLSDSEQDSSVWHCELGDTTARKQVARLKAERFKGL